MQLSPGVSTPETDLTFNVTSVSSNATGFVGTFRWGPVEERVQINGNESELVQWFGQPDTTTAVSFLSAANYLLYAQPLIAVRVVGDTAANAAATTSNVLVKNVDDYEAQTLTDSFIARYPGTMGNSLLVSAANSDGYSTWAYAGEFTYEPTDVNTFNVVVVDEDGVITGNAGTVLERYELMTNTPGSKKLDGTTAYIREAVKNQSRWIFVGDETAISFIESGSEGVFEVSLSNGADDNDTGGTLSFEDGYDLFSDKDQVEIMRVFTANAPVVAKAYAADLMETRQDAIAFVAPELADVYNTVTAQTNVTEFYDTEFNKNSSYYFGVDNWKLVRDRYNDRDVWIPCDSDAAGLHARTAELNEPWFSPAGLNRGVLKNVIRLAWSAKEESRDVLYPKGINSIVAMKGEGNVLWGDRTGLKAPSAFNRINVRTLFIVIKKAIARAARYQLFELNDFITRSTFRNATDQYLDNVKSRRGIYDKLVVCDTTNNTPQVIDANEMVGDIFVKPARSINNIRLNFVATGTGVDFSEVENA